jgi:hypothetical protein
LDADYVRLALLISNSYSMSATQTIDAKPNDGAVDANLASLTRTKTPAIREAVTRIHSGRDRAFQEGQKVQQGVEAADRFLAGVAKDAANGKYVQTYERERVYENPNGTTRTMTEREQVDESTLPLLGAALLNGYVRSRAPEAARNRASLAMERGRLEAWDVLLPKLGEIYPRSKSGQNLFTPRASGPDRESGKGPTFSVQNTSGRLLTDVTLKIDSVHFTTTPHVTNRQIYFVPKWPADASIYLSTALIPNVPSPDYLAGRPQIAKPGAPRLAEFAQGRPRASELWVANVGGVLEFRLAAWAIESQQPEQSIRLPELVEQAGRYELDKAYQEAKLQVLRGFMRQQMAAPNPAAQRQVAELTPAERRLRMRRGEVAAPTGPPPLPPPGYKTPAISQPNQWPMIASKRVLSFAPDGSELSREAKDFQSDPDDYVRQRLTRDLERLVAIVSPGSRWGGQWAFELLSVPPLAGAAAQKTLRDYKGSKGKIVVAIDTFDRSNYTFAGHLFDPAKPDAKRPVNGQISYDVLSIRTAPSMNGAATEGVVDFAVAPLAFMLSRDGNGFSGIASCYQDPFRKNYYFDVSLMPVPSDRPGQ